MSLTETGKAQRTGMCYTMKLETQLYFNDSERLHKNIIANPKCVA